MINLSKILKNKCRKCTKNIVCMISAEFMSKNRRTICAALKHALKWIKRHGWNRRHMRREVVQCMSWPETQLTWREPCVNWSELSSSCRSVIERVPFTADRCLAGSCPAGFNYPTVDQVQPIMTTRTRWIGFPDRADWRPTTLDRDAPQPPPWYRYHPA